MRGKSPLHVPLVRDARSTFFINSHVQTDEYNSSWGSLPWPSLCIIGPHSSIDHVGLDRFVPHFLTRSACCKRKFAVKTFVTRYMLGEHGAELTKSTTCDTFCCCSGAWNTPGRMLRTTGYMRDFRYQARPTELLVLDDRLETFHRLRGASTSHTLVGHTARERSNSWSHIQMPVWR